MRFGPPSFGQLCLVEREDKRPACNFGGHHFFRKLRQLPLLSALAALIRQVGSRIAAADSLGHEVSSTLVWTENCPG